MGGFKLKVLILYFESAVDGIHKDGSKLAHSAMQSLHPLKPSEYFGIRHWIKIEQSTLANEGFAREKYFLFKV